MADNLYALLQQARQVATTSGAKIYGVETAIVTNVKDPDTLGRVKVCFPRLPGKPESDWVRVAQPAAGPDRGFYWLPHVNDEVLIAFERGESHRPYVLGSLWNGKDKPMKAAYADDNTTAMIQTKSGHQIIFDDDSKNGEKIVIADKSGKRALTFDVKNKKFLIEASEGDVEVRAAKKIVFDCEDLEVKTSKTGKIDIGSTFDLKVSQKAQVQAGPRLDMKASKIEINPSSVTVASLAAAALQAVQAAAAAAAAALTHGSPTPTPGGGGAPAAPAKAPKPPQKPAVVPSSSPAAKAKPSDLVVKVTDEANAALSGADVQVTGPESHKAVTDGSGEVTFAGVPAGTYKVTAVKAGYVDGTGQINVPVSAKQAITVVARAVKVTLTVDGVAAADQKTKGALVVRNFDGNKAPRKKITIGAPTAGFAGKILVVPGNKVALFAAASGGSAIAIDGKANAFAAAALPKDLFVEGVTASAAMRDVEVSVNADGGPKLDFATVTVLWVDKPTVALAGNISANNAKAAGYKGWTKSGTDALGLQEYNASFGARMGWGSEARAKVNPSGFNYPGNDLKLERDYDFNDFNDKVVMASGARSASIPPGNDTGPASARDDDPAPDDTIYDWDAAGLGIPNKPVNTIFRTRNNMQAFASITIDGTPVRCSEIRDYFIIFSQKQTAAPTGAVWQVINPPDVAGDNQAAHGTTKTTWDLK